MNKVDDRKVINRREVKRVKRELTIIGAESKPAKKDADESQEPESSSILAEKPFCMSLSRCVDGEIS